MKFLYEMRIVASNHFAFMDLVKKKIFFPKSRKFQSGFRIH